MGTEICLTSCRNRGIGSHNCGHFEDVAVFCATSISELTLLHNLVTLLLASHSHGSFMISVCKPKQSHDVDFCEPNKLLACTIMLENNSQDHFLGNDC